MNDSAEKEQSYHRRVSFSFSNKRRERLGGARHCNDGLP